MSCPELHRSCNSDLEQYCGVRRGLSENITATRAPVAVKDGIRSASVHKNYNQPKQFMQQIDKRNYSTKQSLYDGASPHPQISLFFWTKMKHIAAAVA